MTRQDIINDVKKFLSKYAGDKELGAETRIFGGGLVNSLFAMQLVMYIEKQYKIRVENNDLNLDNFMTLNAISSFIENKRTDQQQ